MVSQGEEGEVGERIEVGGERGTVRWVGSVDGTEGDWLGVEWDREGRGKHDGTHKGTTYFQPVRSGNFCSFLRRAKVEVWGRGLLAAVEERYGAVEGDTAGVEEGRMRELQHEIGARFVEVVGFDKVNREQSDVASLRTISVSGLGVRGLRQRLSSDWPHHSEDNLCLRPRSSRSMGSWGRKGRFGCAPSIIEGS